MSKEKVFFYLLNLCENNLSVPSFIAIGKPLGLSRHIVDEHIKALSADGVVSLWRHRYHPAIITIFCEDKIMQSKLPKGYEIGITADTKALIDVLVHTVPLHLIARLTRHAKNKNMSLHVAMTESLIDYLDKHNAE
jgi:biotin operon repressor